LFPDVLSSDDTWRVSMEIHPMQALRIGAR
jgi:hypothetical protein